ncbi:T9SS type A sorting domain-containing protein [Flammeovirga pectinis]|uniref:T9SS type A sorting domain-containing protein n=1 Tax=Flammeovirga pectinis TaxID=2494373 RepID=A0A3Q9FU40_9BACT|nr:T9SS type A sorting domain-containing protein [Flammeovirga pectinis]AZQ64644.1 T9SS type A sorting domain-containing protein [Flammeovirga pectinis]
MKNLYLISILIITVFSCTSNDLESLGDFEIAKDNNTIKIDEQITFSDTLFVSTVFDISNNGTLTFNNVQLNNCSIILKNKSELYFEKEIEVYDTLIINKNGSDHHGALCTIGVVNVTVFKDGDSTVSTLDGCYGDDLPVEMIYFNSTISTSKNNVLLEWATASEINADRFDVERSTNNRNWTNIGVIKASGNSNVKLDYSFTDSGLPNATIVYYRLKQVDFDGKAYVYGPNAVHLDNSERTLTVYPNPIKYGDDLNILSSFDEMEVRIYDSSGRTYTEFSSDLNHAKVPMIFGKGMLFIEVKSGKTKIVEKLIVN